VKEQPLRVLVAVIVVGVVVTGAVGLQLHARYEAAMDPARFGPVLDELRFPDGWAIPHTDVPQRGGFDVGPSVTRFYLADAEAEATVPEIERAVTNAGFALDRHFGPGCSRDPYPDGPIAYCSVAGVRGTTHVYVTTFARGERVPYFRSGGEPMAGVPGRSVVRVQAGANL
jgi:hypothetical protein